MYGALGSKATRSIAALAAKDGNHAHSVQVLEETIAQLTRYNSELCQEVAAKDEELNTAQMAFKVVQLEKEILMEIRKQQDEEIARLKDALASNVCPFEEENVALRAKAALLDEILAMMKAWKDWTGEDQIVLSSRFLESVRKAAEGR